VVEHLIDTQGWRYDSSGKGHPVLLPADRAQSPLPVPTTPGDSRSFRNWIAQIRRRGGIWPPARSGR
jgi:hypothetical protein